VLARAPFFCRSLYCAIAAAGATTVVTVTKPTNMKIMWRRVVDRRASILRVTANQLLFAASAFGGTDLPFSPRLGLLLSIANIIAAVQLFALALMRCEVV
jgi:hypothetical protein